MPKNLWRREWQERRRMKVDAKARKREIAAKMGAEFKEVEKNFEEIEKELRQFSVDFSEYVQKYQANVNVTFRDITQTGNTLSGAIASGAITMSRMSIGWGTWNTMTNTWDTKTITVPEPPIESENIPILARRHAGLKLIELNLGNLGVTRKLLFTAISGSHGKFGVDADAVCKKRPVFERPAFDDFKMPMYPRHRAPEWNCLCGFYAVPADMMPRFSRANHHVTLQVELSGKIIVHDMGYRAEHQRVLEVLVPNCACGRPCDILQFDPDTLQVAGYVCEFHSTRRLIEEWMVEVMPDYYEDNQKAFATALDSLGIKNSSAIDLTLAQASELAGVEFKR